MSIVWSEGEIRLARELLATGMRYEEICKHLPGRTEKSIRAFLGKRGWGRRITLARGGMGSVISAERPCEAVIAERDNRANEPRTLGQILMGDPPFSQSALALKGTDAATGSVGSRESLPGRTRSNF